MLSAPTCRQSVAYARVFIDVEALIVVAIVNGWRRKSLETVDYHNRLGNRRMEEYAQFLCRETLATSVSGRDAESIEHIRLKLHGVTALLYWRTVVVAVIACRHIDVISRRHSRRLVGVFLRHPRKRCHTLRSEGNGEIFGTQRLHHYRLFAVSLSLKTQYGLIYRARKGKLEVWVMSQFHVRETLVREHLKYC